MAKQNTAADTRAQLLARAAHCYQSAGQERDACRCLEQAGQFGAAGNLHEQAGRWPEAAQCFRQAKQWPQAAHCFLQAGLPDEAARSQLAAGNPLEAAWILAHHAQQWHAARSALATFTPADAEQQLALLLLQARCAVAERGNQASRLVRQVCTRLGELQVGSNHQRVMTWAYILCHEVLDRPDLTQELLACAWQTGIDTRTRWEHWAQQRLGNTEVLGLLTSPDHPNLEEATP